MVNDLIEEQKRIEQRERRRPEAAPQVDARALEGGLRVDDPERAAGAGDGAGDDGGIIFIAGRQVRGAASGQPRPGAALVGAAFAGAEFIARDLEPEKFIIRQVIIHGADDRMLVTLTGVSRFQIVDELDVDTPFRQVIANYHPFAADLAMGAGAAEVNRPALLKVFRDYLDANNMSADWKEVDSAPTEVLVNTLSLLAPYPPQEKQALLEAPDLKTRADVLVALTEVALGKMGKGAKPRLQ